jgi:transcriptional regulator with XRE-family HTH domain
MTLETLGFQSGLDRTGIALIERGRRSPSFNTIMAMLQAMDVSLLEFAILFEEQLGEAKENAPES